MLFNELLAYLSSHEKVTRENYQLTNYMIYIIYDVSSLTDDKSLRHITEMTQDSGTVVYQILVLETVS